MKWVNLASPKTQEEWTTGCRTETWYGNTEFLAHKMTTATSMSVCRASFVLPMSVFWILYFRTHYFRESSQLTFYKGKKRERFIVKKKKNTNRQVANPPTVLSKQTHDFASKAFVQSHDGTGPPWNSELTHFRVLKSSVVEYRIFGVIHGPAATSMEGSLR